MEYPSLSSFDVVACDVLTLTSRARTQRSRFVYTQNVRVDASETEGPRPSFVGALVQTLLGEIP